jgi:NAD-dependent SIR2 family protein deacetylase
MQNKTIVFLGAGFSVPAKIPVQRQILAKMIVPAASTCLKLAPESQKFLYAFINVGLFLLEKFTSIDIDFLMGKQEELRLISRLLKMIQVENIDIKNNAFKALIEPQVDNNISVLKDGLNKEFIKKVIVSDSKDSESLRKILEAHHYNVLVGLKEAVRCSLENAKIKVDLEDVFTIFDKSLKKQENWGTYTYQELDGLRHSLLRLFTYYFGKTIREFKAVKPYESFVSFCNITKPTVITTNWDTILEKLFRINSKKILRVGVKPEISNEEQLRIIKLHGSIDWLHCNNCGSLIIIPENEVGDCLFKDKIQAQCKKCMWPEDDSKVVLSPAIITPTMFKAVDSDIFVSIWSEAAKELSGADRIIFVGYSLPIADFEIRYLLKKNIRANTKIDVVLHHNNKPKKSTISYEPETRYRNVFSANPIEFHYTGFKNYFMEDSNFH